MADEGDQVEYQLVNEAGYNFFIVFNFLIERPWKSLLGTLVEVLQHTLMEISMMDHMLKE